MKRKKKKGILLKNFSGKMPTEICTTDWKPR